MIDFSSAPQLLEAARQRLATSARAAHRQPEAAGRLPLFLAQRRIGSAAPEVARFLAAKGNAFRLEGGELRIAEDATTGVGDFSTTLQTAALALRDAGLLHGWRGERQCVFDTAGREAAHCERALLPLLGLQSRAVHINGLTSDGDFWLARRALSKSVDPGRLDNLAAGGIVAGEAIAETLLRELDEEAGVPAELARRAVPLGQIRSIVPDGLAWRDELLFVHALVLPDRFIPFNRDGEVAEFMRLPPTAIARLLPGEELTPDAAAATALCILSGARTDIGPDGQGAS